MDFLYGIMGQIARVTERLSRTSGNGIPMNWAVLIIVAILTCAALFKLAEATRNTGAPKQTTVAQIAGGSGMLDTYVTINAPAYPITARDTGADPVPDKSVFALVEGGQAIYVVTGNSPGDVAAVKSGHVSGMVRNIDKELKDQLDTTPPMINDTIVSDQHVVMRGETPPSPILWVVLFLIGAAVTIAMSAVIFMRYIVFRPVATCSQTDPSNAGNPAMPIRASGVFIFSQNPKLKLRFLDMPAALTDMASGDKGLVSNVDASVRFMGQVTKNRSGTWALVMKSGTVSDIEDGLQYVGFKSRPAIRFSYVDAMTGKASDVVVNFAGDAERRAFRARL